MMGLFGTLTMGARSLQIQRQGVEVAGQNLANVNNPACARQRLVVQAGVALPTAIGPQGSGVDAVSIQQLRNHLVDRQIQGELSAHGFLEAQQRTLEYLQAALSEQIDRQTAGSEAAAAAGSAGSQPGLADDLSRLFNAFQGLSTSPSSPVERQAVLMRAQQLAGQFNQTDRRLGNLQATLNESLDTDLAKANQLIHQIADLNDQVINAESHAGGLANDLRDLRQQKIEELSKLINVESATAANGAVNLSLGGHELVADHQVLDTLRTYDAGEGRLLVRGASSGAPLTLTGGSVQGTIAVRDGALATLRQDMNTLAATLIGEGERPPPQRLLQDMLQRQRDALGGVSLDEEMTGLVQYQKAFEASACFVSTVSEMLDEVVHLKR